MKNEKQAIREKVVDVSELVFSERTRIQCMHGCMHYKRGPFCPANCPDYDEMSSLIRHYDKVTVLYSIIEYADQADLIRKRNAIHEGMLSLEQEMKRAGHYYTISLISGPCSMCDAKICHAKECRRTNIGRYPVCASGIDLQHLCKDLLDLTVDDAMSFWRPHMPRLFDGDETKRSLYLGMIFY